MDSQSNVLSLCAHLQRQYRFTNQLTRVDPDNILPGTVFFVKPGQRAVHGRTENSRVLARSPDVHYAVEKEIGRAIPESFQF